nr:reverse transcriptase domain-containing protein [Tanacetum cinerariifolium]
MADRTMEELLQAPTEGYGEAIVISEILTENFKIKTNLLQLVQANKFHGFKRDSPYTHISNLKRMTTTLKYRDVLNDVIKLMLFPYSLEGASIVWYKKEPPNSILTWDDLVNQFFPPSKTTHLKNEISRFTQRFKESFEEAWDRFNNTIPNPKGLMKAVTTCSGFAYEGPSIPTESLLEKVDEQNIEEILDKEHSNSSGSTTQVQPAVVPISIPKTDSLLANKDKLFELAKVPLNENCSAMLLKKLPEKLGDPVVDFEAGPRVPLILGRSFLRTGRVLIDVYGEEFSLRVNDESITFNLNQTMRYSSTYDDTLVKRVDVIDIACEEFVQDVLDFQVNDESITFNLDQIMRYSDNSVNQVNVINIASEEVVQDNPKSSSPTLVSESDFCEDPIVKTSPFGESDFFSEEIENFLKDDSIPKEYKNYVFDLEGDILFIEKLLNEDPYFKVYANLLFYFDKSDFVDSPRLPLEPLDVQVIFNFKQNSEEVILDELNKDEYFNPGGEIDDFTNVEDNDYFTFIFVI